MHFKDNKNSFFVILFFGAASFIAGMTLEDMLNLPQYAIMLIGNKTLKKESLGLKI